MLSNPKLTISWEDKGKGRETKTDDFSQAFDDAILFALKDNAASLLRAFIDPTLFPEMQSLKTEYKKIKLAMTSKAKERDIRQKQCEFLAVMARREQYDAGINKNLNVLLIHLLASQEQYSSNESVNEENNIVSSTLEQVAEYEKYKLYQIKNQEEVKRLYKTTQDVLAQVEDQYKKLVEQHTKNKEKNKEKKQEILQRVRDNAAEPIRRFLNAHYGYLAHEELTQLEIFFREKKISLVDVMQRLKENNFSLFDLATHRQSFDVIELLLTLHSEKERETFLTAVHPEC